MTAVTPSTVTELSATFVARISFSLRRGRERPVLLPRRQTAMQRKHQQSRPAGNRVARSHRTTNLHRSRQKHQSVAGVSGLDQQLHRVPHLCFEWLRRVRQMLDRKVEQPSFGTHDRTTVKIFRHGIGIESRRHDHDSQIGSRALQSLQQCQREIAFEVALVKFIEHHRRHALQDADRRAAAA